MERGIELFDLFTVGGDTVSPVLSGCGGGGGGGGTCLKLLNGYFWLHGDNFHIL